MSGFRIEGSLTGNVAEVTSANEIRTTGSATKANAGYSVLITENDDGALAGGTPLRNSPTVSNDQRLSVGIDTPLFDAGFTATTQDTGIWKYAFTTMLSTQGGGYVTFNSSSLGTTTIGAALQSWRNFPLVNNGGLRVAIVAGPTAAIAANQVAEFGWFAIGTPTVAPTEGVYFRVTSAGIVGIMNYNGVETVTSILDSSLLAPQSTIEYQIRMYTDSCSFYAAGKFLGKIDTPVGNPQATMTSSLPVSFQMRHSGTVTSPCQWKLGHVSVDQRDTQTVISYETQQAAMGLMGYQGTSGNTQGTTALYSNSLVAGAGAILTNTTAAAGVGLGGQFSVQPTLAAGVDGILCSYQVPVGTINIRPRTLVIRGVKIYSCVTTVLAGNATPVVFAYSLAFGHTALSLATAEGASFSTGTTKAPRRVALGYESYAAAAAVGSLGSPNGIAMTFLAPIVVNPSEFVAIAIKNIGAVTTTGVVTFSVTFDAYWI